MTRPIAEYLSGRYCKTCGHGYGVHLRQASPLVIKRSEVVFAESQGAAQDWCTGYPDKMEKDGLFCDCKKFVHG